MTDFYFSTPLDNKRTLHLGPLTSRVIAESGQEVVDAGGYYLFESCRDDGVPKVEIIAQVVSEDAALKLREMLSME